MGGCMCKRKLSQNESFQNLLFEGKNQQILQQMGYKDFRRKAEFSNLGYTCIQMALIWGYEAQVLKLLKTDPDSQTGKNQVRSHDGQLGQDIYQTAVMTDSKLVRDYLELEFNYQRKDANREETKKPKKNKKNSGLLKALTTKPEDQKEAPQERLNYSQGEKSIDLMVSSQVEGKIKEEEEEESESEEVEEKEEIHQIEVPEVVSDVSDREDSNIVFKISEPQEENINWVELNINEKKNMDQLNKRAKTVAVVRKTNFNLSKDYDDDDVIDSPIFKHRKQFEQSKTLTPKNPSSKRGASAQIDTKEELLENPEKGFSSGADL